MTDRIAIIILIATLFYIIIPSMGQLFFVSRRKKLLSTLRSAKGIFAVCSSWHNETLTIDPVGMNELPFNIAPARTRFFILEKEGSLEKSAWNTVSLIKKGVTLLYFPGRTRHSRGICVFHEETTEKSLRERFGQLAETTRNGTTAELRLKYFSVAIGAFLEFFLFVESLGSSLPDINAQLVSIAAIVAIFGKALPYCPPGLFLTLIAHFIAKKGSTPKKNRQLRATGFALVIGGVALNIFVVFFVIARFGIK